MGYNISILKLLYHGIMIIWVRCNQHKIYIYSQSTYNQYFNIYIYIINVRLRTMNHILQYEQLLIRNTHTYMEMIPINY